MVAPRWMIVWIGCIYLLPTAWLSAAEPITAAAMTRRVDELINAKLADEKIPPGELATDAEFLRRASVDLDGRVPRVSEVRAFLADSRPDRRAILIDELLAKPTHSTHLATMWRRVLLPENADITRFGGDRGFEFWLRQQFVDNVPYDKIARDVLLAEGQASQGPTLFYTAFENKPEQLAAATSRVFLGLQIECAQCHDHPHDQWKQEDFWGYAAFFARLQKPNGQQTGVLMVADSDTGEVEHPLTGKPVPPRFLGTDVDVKPIAEQSRRAQLATWMTSPENDYFARAAVNRAWAMLFGRGLVEPVDDLGRHNPPSHPQLMQELADYFVATNYDLQNLVRVLANTEAYQRTSRMRDGETPTKPELFARMAIKTFTAEQLYDSLQVATVRREMPNAGMNELGIAGFDANRAAFLDKFRGPKGSASEYHAGIPQALTLMNGTLVEAATNVETSDLLRALQAPFFTNEQRVETLFLATLGRLPHDDEREKYLSYFEGQATDTERRAALGDMLWALLNTAEFTLNH